MKNTLISLVSAICILFSLTVTVSANSEFIVEDNRLVSYTGQEKNVVIPTEVNGEAIIFIDSLAFNCNDYIETVTISDGVEIINSEAFKNCYNLKEVMVPESLVDICAYAFSGCYDLEPIELKSEWTTIDEDAYTDADRNVRPSLFATSDYTMDGGTIVAYNGTDTELVIPETIDGVTVTAIGASAFQGNTTITSVTIPDTVTTIGEQAFYRCTEIKDLKISKNLKACGKNAFAYCSSLTEVTIPGSMTKTGQYMFYYCVGIKKVVIEEGVKKLDDHALHYCTELTEIVFPESMADISTWSMGNCEKISNITMPSKLTNIGDAAFYGCKSLNNVVIPDTVTYTGSHSFRYCMSLTNIKLSKNARYIAHRAFSPCPLKTIEIPDTYSRIVSEAFYDCKDLETLEIPNSINKIDDKVFFNCIKLKEITSYDNLTDIGNDIFGTSNGVNTTINVYAPETSAMYEYAETNGITSKPIVAENVAIIVGEDSLGTYGTINYPITDKVESIGMCYIPEHLKDNAEAPVLDIAYDDVTVNNGNTFMTLMTGIDDTAMDWTYIATPYVKLTDGTTIWGNGKAFGLDFIRTNITWEE